MLYNRQPYNIRPPTEDVRIYAHVPESLYGLVRVDSPRFLRSAFNIQPYNRFVLDDLKLSARIAFREQLTGSAPGTEAHESAGTAAETLTGHAVATTNDLAMAGVVESLTGGTIITLAYEAPAAMGEALSGYVNAYHITEYVTTILGDLPPGAILTIDAENFNMTLAKNGVIEDVIHLHDGDWLEVSRNTLSLMLSGTGSTFNWEVFYIAKYL